MKKTIIDLFEDSVVKYGAKTFLLEKKHRAFEPTTYAAVSYTHLTLPTT